MASCLSIRWIKYFINYILEYINVEVVSCYSNRRIKGGLNIFINDILEYINVEVASCHSTRGISYFYKLYFRIHYCISGFMTQY